VTTGTPQPPEEDDMSTSRRETAPDGWDEARDVGFSSITARLFPPGFCLGASVLLASCDDEPPPPAPAPAAAPSGRRPRIAPQPVRASAA
jgi:hypothetical protein